MQNTLFNTPIRITVKDKVFHCECIEDPDAVDMRDDFEDGYVLWRCETISHHGVDVTDLVFANDELREIVLQRINFVFNAQRSCYFYSPIK